MISFARLQRGIEKLAHRFGIHVATHQIRLILISSVVITSLFYPALALYSRSSQKGILDSFLAARLNAQAGSLRNVLAARVTPKHDLVSIWEGRTGIKVVEDTVPKSSQCARRGFQVERILLQTEDADAVTNEEILYKTLRLERRITELQPNQPLLKLSPLAFWDHDESSLTRDPNVLDTLGPRRNVSVGGIKVTPNMVLAGRGKDESATFLAVTYVVPLIPVDDADECPSRTIHRRWLELLKEATGASAHVGPGIEEPTFITLEYDVHRIDRSPVTQTMLYIAYSAFLVYVAYSIRLMHSVHSRVGLAFTAVVEIVVSTIGSLSLCALVGFRVDRVPWAFLFIVILCVGAENMFSLVDAVVQTPVTLAVKDRIGVGLSRAGKSNTFKVVSYNTFLGFIAGLVHDDTVRQFCIFAIVVLIAHWFLAHTFFLAVLSIDIQRLDLEEVLRQNAAGTKTPTKTDSQNTPWQKWQRFWGGRAVKNLSFVLLVLITSTLYYTTFTHPADPRVFNQRAALTRSSPQTSTMRNDQQGGSYRTWRIFNPSSFAPVPLRLESPTIITFGSHPGIFPVARRRSRWLPLRDLHPLVWLIKIVSLQITVTTSLLYLLCRYLLKDADALDAHRNHPNSHDAATTEQVQQELDLDAEFASKTHFQTLPRAFASDVELLASSGDGRLVAAIGTHNELVIWSAETQVHLRISTKELMSLTASTSAARLAISAIAVEDKGRSIAVGTAGGVIGVWAVEASGVRSLPHLTRNGSPSGVKEILFLDATPSLSLLAIYEDHQSAKWMFEDGPAMAMITPSHAGTVLQCMAVAVNGGGHVLLCYSMEDGSLDVVDVKHSTPVGVSTPLCNVPASNSSDPVVGVHATRAPINGGDQLLIVAVTDAGYISLWDGLTGDNITNLEDAFGPVSALRILSVPSKTCSKCNELPPESLILSFSIGNSVLIYKLHLPSQTRLCACSPLFSRLSAPQAELTGSRSRSGSKASTNGTSVIMAPPNGRARLGIPSAFNSNTFPVSGHGMHSRRADKESTRRLSDVSATPVANGGLLEPPSPVSSLLPRANWESVNAMRLVELPCERGSWNVWAGRLIGVRRRRRMVPKTRGPKSSNSPSHAARDSVSAALERWELWCFDPTGSQILSAPLAELHQASTVKDIFPRLPFTRAVPFVVSASTGFIGLGNAVGFFKLAP